MLSKKNKQKNLLHKSAKGILILVILLGVFANANHLNIAAANSGQNESSTPSGTDDPALPTETPFETATEAAHTETPAPTPWSTPLDLEPTPSGPIVPEMLLPTDEASLSEGGYLVDAPYKVFLPLLNTKYAYYVSLSGSDQNPGTIERPWRTIQKAANTVGAGDTVYIRGGTYNERVRMLSRNIGSRMYITFTNYPGESVILDGNGIGILYGGGLFHIEKSEYIRLSGLRIQRSNGAGVYVLNSNNIKVDHNFTYDTVKSGVGIWRSNNVVVDGNDIALACNSHQGYIATEENISIAASSFNVEVKNNYVHHAANIGTGYAGGEGITVKDGSHDIIVHHNIVRLDERPDGKDSTRLAYAVDAWLNDTYNVSFYSNIAYNNYDGFVVESEEGGTVHDIYVYNNIAYNNINTGFYIPNWEQNETSLKKNIYFVNNTAHNTGRPNHPGKGFYINSVKIENVVIHNNLLWRNTTPIVIGAGVPVANISQESNLSDKDPLFVNASAGNFHLQSGSPAIDKGYHQYAPATDMDGNSRPQLNGYDIGADEFVTQ